MELKQINHNIKTTDTSKVSGINHSLYFDMDPLSPYLHSSGFS